MNQQLLHRLTEPPGVLQIAGGSGPAHMPLRFKKDGRAFPLEERANNQGARSIGERETLFVDQEVTSGSGRQRLRLVFDRVTKLIRLQPSGELSGFAIGQLFDDPQSRGDEFIFFAQVNRDFVVFKADGQSPATVVLIVFERNLDLICEDFSQRAVTPANQLQVALQLPPHGGQFSFQPIDGTGLRN